MIRTDRDLTRREVATRLGISEQQLYRYEVGKTPVKDMHLLALAAVYGVAVDELEEGVAA